MDKLREEFEKAYIKTDYYQINYEKTNACNSVFSWNSEANCYTWHDVNSSWLMWQQAEKVAVPDRHLVVNKGDYVELVKTNSERQETIARLTEEVKIIRERKKFYKNKCKSLIPEGYVVVPKHTIETLVTYGSSYASEYDIDDLHEAVNNYKAMIEAVEKNDE